MMMMMMIMMIIIIIIIMTEQDYCYSIGLVFYKESSLTCMTESIPPSMYRQHTVPGPESNGTKHLLHREKIPL
jgi:hypothetical protein